MSRLFIHAINSAFDSRDEGAEYDTPESALALAVGSALTIAADEIHLGAKATAVEIRVENEGGSALLRTVVSVSVAHLLTNLGATPPAPAPG